MKIGTYLIPVFIGVIFIVIAEIIFLIACITNKSLEQSI